jgi:hypothetical protein
VHLELVCSFAQVVDVGGIQGVAQELRFDILAEAYVIDVRVQFPKPSESYLDFGTLRGVDEARQKLTLINGGQHGVNFKVSVRRQVGFHLNLIEVWCFAVTYKLFLVC